MYFVGLYEFRRYMYASERLREIKAEHELEIRRAYADIHPTRVGFNLGLGKVYSESVNVADYAIWLIETKELHAKQEAYWRRRAEAFEKAVRSLPDEQLTLLMEAKAVPELLTPAHRQAMDAARKALGELIAATPELHARGSSARQEDGGKDVLEAAL